MIDSYALFHIHSEFSLLDGFGSIKQNVQRAKELGIKSLSLSDHGTIAGLVQHWSTCKKEGIKPILGIELYIPSQSAHIQNKDNRSLEHFVLWVKNKTGWENLLRLVAQTNTSDYFYYKPRIHLYDHIDENGKKWPGLESFVGPDKGIMSFNGHQGTRLSNILFMDPRQPVSDQMQQLKKGYGQYKGETTEYHRQFLQPHWLEDCCAEAVKLESIFGKGNFFIELQNELNTKDQIPLMVHPLIVECLREVSKKTGIPAMASSDPHYPAPEHAVDQRLMVMINMKETEDSVQKKLESEDEMDLMVFFGSNSFYIKSLEEMKEKFTETELEQTLKVAEQVEEFDIRRKPIIPLFDIPSFPETKYTKNIQKKEDKYLMHLCIEGAQTKRPWVKTGIGKNKYWERLQEELSTLREAGISRYFLLVWDICMACDNRPSDHSFGWQANLSLGGKTDPVFRGRGRGSAAGCLVSYLINITDVDPLEYNLLFSRFYNAGRNTGDHISMADIDLDQSGQDREWTIDYLKHKYSNVYPMVTFGRMQGRAAIKDIFRVKGVEGGFDLANEICKHVPDESKISDELQEARGDGDEDYGIIDWSLDHSEEFKEYYSDPNIKELIDQSIKCEGKKKSQGRHASGYIVCDQDVLFPIAYDTKGKQPIVGIEMGDAEKLGGVKVDLLGISTLDKLKECQQLVGDMN